MTVAPDDHTSNAALFHRDLGMAASQIELSYREAEESRSKRSELRSDPTGRVETYAGADGQHYWRLIDTSNGQTVAQGQGYADPRDRDHLINKRFAQYETVQVTNQQERTA